MSISKILQAELEENAVSSLATRPSSPSLYGGRMLSAKELRAAFDKLPFLLAERFNRLIDAFGLYTDEKSGETLASLIATGIIEGHSLEALFADITSGRFATYLSLDGETTLASLFARCKSELDALADTIAALQEGKKDFFLRLDAQEAALAAQTQKQERDNAQRAADTLAVENEAKTGLDTLRKSLPARFRIAEVPSDAYAKVYRLECYGGEGVPSEGDFSPTPYSLDINIPKDLVVKKGELRTCEVAGVPVASYRVGEAYIDLTLSTEDAAHIYIRVGDLVKTTILYAEGDGDIVTGITSAGNTLTLHKTLSSATLAKAERVKVIEERLLDLPPHTLVDEETGRVYTYSLAIEGGKPGILLTEKV